MKKKYITVLLVLLAALILYADVPPTISYQGILKDLNGNPVPDGNYKLKFTLSNNSGNNPVLWEETLENVPVNKGLFNVILGSSNPISLPFDEKYYLGISINDGATLQPLTELTSVPYSLNVSDNAAVKSISGMRGEIDFVAGNNITVTYDTTGQNTITISSSGNGGALTLPYNGTVSGSLPGFVINSTGSGTAIVGRNTGTNRAATFEIDNLNNVGSALFASTNGTGRAGDFQVNNSNNQNAALFASSNGNNQSKTAQLQMSGTGTNLVLTHIGSSGRFATFQADGQDKVTILRDGRGTFLGGILGNSSVNTVPAVSGFHSGNGAAESFQSSGFGAAVRGYTEGTGRAGDFTIQNASSSAFALFGASNGSGSAGFLQMSGTGTGLTVHHIGVSGNIAVFQNSGSNVARIDKTGKGFFNGGTQAGGADIAEAFDVEGSVNNYEPGDVLIISLNKDRTVELSYDPYSKLVAGVYATKPGVLLSERNIDEDHSDMIPMGVVGVIPTKVTNQNGPIRRGDLLVTSGIPGHAMKGTDNGRLLGAVIGKALQDFDGTRGIIKVLVNSK